MDSRASIASMTIFCNKHWCVKNISLLREHGVLNFACSAARFLSNGQLTESTSISTAGIFLKSRRMLISAFDDANEMLSTLSAVLSYAPLAIRAGAVAQLSILPDLGNLRSDRNTSDRVGEHRRS
jgi:hypothetical protein